MTSNATGSPIVPAERKRGGSVRRLHDQEIAQDSDRGANEAKTRKLRHGSLRRHASARGLELRHSAHGYSLIDSTRNRVERRNDMTLDDVESYLARLDAGRR